MTGPHVIDREEVMAYLDGELPAARMAIVGRHLETCESCRALAADFRAVSSRLGEWQVEPPPAVLDVSVRAALEAAPLVTGSPESTRRWRWRMFLTLPVVRVAGMTAAAAGVILAGWMISRPVVQREAAPVASIAPSADQVSRLEKPAAAAEPTANPAGVGQGSAGAVAQNRELDRPQGLARVQPRLDAIEEVKVSQQGQGQRGAPTTKSEPVITSPPLSTPVPTSPPPPPPAAVKPPAAPVTTQTAVTAARDSTVAGAGAGGRGGGGRQAMSEVVIDSSRNSLSALPFLPGVANRPMIARRAEMTIVTTRFDSVRAEIGRVLPQHEAIVVSSKTSDPREPRAIDTVVRLPVEQFDRAMAALRELGRVTRDAQSSEDLEVQAAALASKWTLAQRDEAALQDQLVRQRGDREAVLTTEQALARAREDRVRLESEARFMSRRVTHVEVVLRVEESK